MLSRTFNLWFARARRETTDIFIAQNHTGSWSFSEAIQDVLSKERTFSLEAYTLAKDVREMPALKVELKALREHFESLPGVPLFVYSHRPVPVHLALRPAQQPKARYLTLMRNPVSRVLSCYFWLAKHKQADVHWVPQIIRDGASLDEWLDDLLARGQWPSGIWPGEYFYESWLRAGLVPAKVGSGRYEVVKYVLDTYFPYIGITELFDESLYVFAQFKLLPCMPTWRLLGNSDRPDNSQIGAKTIEKIEQFVELDTYLYEHYRKKFESDHAQEIAYFREHVGTLRGNQEVDHKPMI